MPAGGGWMRATLAMLADLGLVVAFAVGLALLVAVVAHAIEADQSLFSPGADRDGSRGLPPWVGVALLAATFLGAAAAWWFRRSTLPCMPVRGSALRATGVALACGMAMLALSLLAIPLRSGLDAAFEPSNEAGLRALAAHPVALVLLVVLVAPLVEELVFRHMLLRRFVGAGRPWLGLILTSLLFGFIHETSIGDRDPATYLLMLGLYIAMGAALGLAYIVTGRYWVAVAGHALNNGIGVIGLLAA